MAKSSDYRSLAGTLATAYVKGRLMVDAHLSYHLTGLLEYVIVTAIKLKAAEEEAKRK